jgi:protocatechuate 3,4-dioxygenase beta subunit
MGVTSGIGANVNARPVRRVPSRSATLGFVDHITRRHLLGIGLAALPLPALLTAARISIGTRVPTPACGKAGKTHRQTEGPFFSTGSPERTSLRESGMDGTPLTVTGTVLDTRCSPLAGAKLDFWQADAHGNYDNEGFRLRGHQFTDNSGKYVLDTIVPGLYPGRTRHVHVKVQPKGGRVLTTQLYFPHEKRNRSDGIFDAALPMDVHRGRDGRAARFDFVLVT